MRPLSIIIATIVATIFLTACPNTKTPMPAALRDKMIKKEIDDIETLVNQYESAVQAGDTANLNKAQLLRNELIHRGIMLVDANYNDFENSLFVGRANTNVLADFTELGIAAATGITNGERVKTILAISLTAFK